MGIVSYAQNFEDVMLWRALRHVQQGFYIDIGAQDPVVDSVSLAFYEQGWRGIHVEATPAYAEKIRQARPDELVLQVAVNDQHGVISFYEIPGTGISTGDEGIADSHRAKGFEVRRITVPCITLGDILEQAKVPDIHWLKIDVEGMEASVLKSWGKGPLLPWIVVVESTLPLTQVETQQEWETHLLKRGYKAVYFDGLNRYYVSPQHPELIEAFGSGPNVFDGFTLNGTASAPFCARVVQASSQKENDFRQQLDRLQQEHQQALQVRVAALLEQERKNEEQAGQISLLREQLSNNLTSHVERERFLLAQVQSLQQQTQTVQAEVANRERALRNLAEETVSRAQNEAQDHLKELVQRERTYAQELQSVREELALLQQRLLHQQQAAQKEHDELLLKGSARERALQGLVQETYRRGQAEAQIHLQSVVQREQEISRELQALHQQMQGMQKAAQQEREQLLQANRLEVDQMQQAAHQERNELLQEAQREREQLQQVALREKEALLLEARRDRRELQREAISRERALQGIIQETYTRGQAEQQLNLKVAVQREQEYSRELKTLQQQMLHMQQDAAQRERNILTQADKALDKVREEARHYLATLAQREKEYAQELQSVQQRMLQSQQEATEHQQEIETRLQAEIAAERQVTEQLRTSLAETQHLLSLTHASLSWRLTAPFRRLAGIFRYSGDPPDALPNLNGDSALMVAASQIPQINPITQPVNTTLMLMENSTTSPASTLEELLGLHDRHFVDCAYKTLLGRPTDPDGLAYYLGRLRAGFPKIGLLAQLRLSTEGRGHTANVAGLDKAIQQYRRGQLPVVGWLLRWLESTEGRQPFECRLRRIEGQLLVLSEESRHRFDQLTLALEGIREQIKHPGSVTIVSEAVPTSVPKPVQTSVQEKDLGLLTPRARDIYLKLAQG